MSNLGRVQSLPRRIEQVNGHVRSWPAKMLEPGLDHYGYPRTVLCVDNKRTYKKVAVLVAEAFIGPSCGQILRHLDDNKLNSRLYNLMWGSHKDNMDDLTRNGRITCKRQRPMVLPRRRTIV